MTLNQGHKQQSSLQKILKHDEQEENKSESYASSSETQSDTSSEDSPRVEATVRPMLDILKVAKFESFVIDSQAGITGHEVIAQYPCLLDGSNFFVLIGATDISMFDKNTFMTLANFGEDHGA